jgi:hypothetical protein
LGGKRAKRSFCVDDFLLPLAGNAPKCMPLPYSWMFARILGIRTSCSLFYYAGSFVKSHAIAWEGVRFVVGRFAGSVWSTACLWPTWSSRADRRAHSKLICHGSSAILCIRFNIATLLQQQRSTYNPKCACPELALTR